MISNQNFLLYCHEFVRFHFHKSLKYPKFNIIYERSLNAPSLLKESRESTNVQSLLLQYSNFPLHARKKIRNSSFRIHEKIAKKNF